MRIYQRSHAVQRKNEICAVKPELMIHPVQHSTTPLGTHPGQFGEIGTSTNAAHYTAPPAALEWSLHLPGICQAQQYVLCVDAQVQQQHFPLA